jgi:hypothetical protein
MATAEAASEVLRRDGLVYETPGGMRRRRPEVEIQQSATKEYISLLERLDLL